MKINLTNRTKFTLSFLTMIVTATLFISNTIYGMLFLCFGFTGMLLLFKGVTSDTKKVADFALVAFSSTIALKVWGFGVYAILPVMLWLVYIGVFWNSPVNSIENNGGASGY